MRRTALVGLMLVAVIGAGCSATQLKASKDDSWSHFPSTLPDHQDGTLGGYGHPFRAAGFMAHPIGVALDYALVRPFYLLGGLAPEWFGVQSEDALRYNEHMPELVAPKSQPHRFD